MRYDLLVFDLDGTLLDSFRDIHETVNELLFRYHLGPLDASAVKTAVGKGVRHLLSLVFTAAGGSVTNIEAMMAEYSRLYETRCLNNTRPFSGVLESLKRLEGMTLAVLSNKPERATRFMLSSLGMDSYFSVIAGGDSFGQMKPSAEPLLRILELTGAAASRSLMVGDTSYDIETGRNAGVATCAVSFGFQAANILKALNPDYLVNAFEEIVDIAHGSMRETQSKR